MNHPVLILISSLLLCGAQGLPHPVSESQISRPPEEEQDRVKHLPGAPSLDFDLFSGYVPVDDDAGRALFYVLAESTDDPQRDPLVLWLNGGPGCSSLGGGFMSELGPFYPSPGGDKLVRNDFAWNRVANLLFLESPAFVGWSYSNRSEDAEVGDQRTAADSYTFLRRWLRRFPRYAARPLWLAGESYGGHYLPNLAREIVRGNAAANDESERIIFQGFLVGNALTVPEVDSRGAMLFWYTHGIISATAYHGAMKFCDFATIYPLADEQDMYVPVGNSTARGGASVARRQLAVAAEAPTSSALAAKAVGRRRSDAEKCTEFVDQAMGEFSGVNIYDIYADVCIPSAPGSPGTKKRVPSSSTAHVRQLARLLRDHAAGVSARPALHQPDYDPCIDNEVELYFNRPDVQAALHANTSGDLPGPWTTCTQAIDYSRRDLLASMLPVYEELLRSGIRMLVYTGDVDAIVPVIGTRRWIMSLGLEVEEPWRAWRSASRQVGGWLVAYSKGLTFASVRGAGHMVPYTQPERAFHLFSRWVHGKPL